MQKLTQILIPIQKEGCSKGDLLTAISEDSRYKDEELGIAIFDSDTAIGWQAMQLLICDESADINKGDKFLSFYEDESYMSINENTMDNFEEYADIDYTSECVKIISSYPHIPGTQDFTPYIKEYVRMNGESEVEYETEKKPFFVGIGGSKHNPDPPYVKVDESVPKKDKQGNYLFRLVANEKHTIYTHPEENAGKLDKISDVLDKMIATVDSKAKTPDKSEDEEIEDAATRYANKRFECCKYNYDIDQRSTDFDKINEAFKAGWKAHEDWLKKQSIK